MKERENVPLAIDENKGTSKRSDVRSETSKSPELQDTGGAASGIHLGLELALSVGIGSGLGIALDKWLGTSPFFLVTGLLLGCIAGFLAMIRGTQGRRGTEKDVTISKSDKQT